MYLCSNEKVLKKKILKDEKILKNVQALAYRAEYCIFFGAMNKNKINFS